MTKTIKDIKKHKGALLFLALFVLVLVLDQVFGWSTSLASEDSVRAMHLLLEQNYWLAVAVYFAVTIVGSVVLALPGALFAILAAALFGALLGTLWCVLAATVGACGAFMMGRYFLKDSVKPWVSKNDALRKLLFDNAGENAVKLLAVTRLVPLFPFNVQNFAYGITDIRFFTYAWCTFVFLIPGTALYTFATAGLLDAQDRWLYLGIALVLLAVVLLSGALLRNKDLIIRWEKSHYPFRNWRHAQQSVFFPGCNAQALFPQTMEAVLQLLREKAQVGVVYDCCGKPLEERSMENEDSVLEGLKRRLRQHGVEELICACPNCYAYLKPRLDGVRVVSVYEKLEELDLLPRGIVETPCSVYPPCPDKGRLTWYSQLEGVFAHKPTLLEKTPCCGLGKPGLGKSKQQLNAMAQACLAQGVTYTYCASCVGCLNGRAAKDQSVGYVLGAVVGVAEDPQVGASVANRLKGALR